MRRHFPTNCICIVLLWSFGSSALGQLNMAAKEPVATKHAHLRDVNGERFEDDYFWLRDRKNPEVLAYLKASNAHADAVMAPTKALQDKLYKEIVGHIQETDLTVPTFDRGYYYYTRTAKGHQYETYCRRKGSMKAREEVLLDVDSMAKDKPFFDIGVFEVSPNGHLLAYSVDTSGYREYQLRFKDLRTGKDLAERFGKVDDVIWAGDNKTVYFTTEDAAKRPDKLYRRSIGSAKAELLWHEPVAQYNLSAGESRDHKYLFAESVSSETSEIRFLKLGEARPTLRMMVPRREGIEYYPEHRNGTFYIRTNDHALEWRVVSAPADHPERKNWKPVLQEPDATVTGMEVFDRYLVVNLRKDAVESTVVCDLKTGEREPIAFPESYYQAGLGANPDFFTKTLRLNYVSQITPRTVYEYDPSNAKLKVLKRQVVPGYNRSEYATELLWLHARDGEKIPVPIAYRKGVAKPAPMFLDAYGAYGIPNDPGFSVSQLSLMDRGFIIGTALVRGGGEMGERWHDAGKMATKINTFQDFIDCSMELQRLDYTTPEKLGITGGSAGGLTMGAVLNMAPETFRVALVYVPFVDVINTMLDETLPLTTQEFLEWGNPKIPEQYSWIRAYSPYDNVGAMDYPAMLVRTSLNDSQVPYWEPCKWVARLREKRTDEDPLLLKVDLAAGHGGASGRYNAYRETAYDFAFLLTVLGMDKR